MAWEIIREGFDAALAAELGNRFLCGNGCMGVRGTLEEYGKEQLAAVNLAGIYHRHGEGWREPLNAPNPFYVKSVFEGVSLSVLENPPLSHAQGIDFLHGIQMRDTVFDAGGSKAAVSCRRFACMRDVHLLAMRYTVTPEKDGLFSITCGIDSDVWDIHGPHYNRMDVEYGEDTLTCRGGQMPYPDHGGGYLYQQGHARSYIRQP